MINIPIKKATIDYDYNELDGFIVNIEVGSGYTHSANTIKKMIDSGMDLEFCIKKPTEDKTRNQLATAWSAMREMAEALDAPIAEIYHKMIKDYGKFTHIMSAIEDVDTVIESHTNEREGNFAEVVGRAKNDQNLMVIKLYWGLSTYSKKDMSIFLDGLCREHDEMFG